MSRFSETSKSRNALHWQRMHLLCFNYCRAFFCKTYILHHICIDTTNWFCGSLVFLFFCKWLFCWTSLPIPGLLGFLYLWTPHESISKILRTQTLSFHQTHRTKGTFWVDKILSLRPKSSQLKKHWRLEVVMKSDLKCFHTLVNSCVWNRVAFYCTIYNGTER